ncbi:sugar phosphate isomerase/epimerase [Agreia sp. COWG]|uniref:sugar phosphate isomerase/epimerase family protein n=1 Tax=Agreia sp. COWG TaxID=2773266 RepID=UPI0019257864|nr:sugar phosphate isomerase/epimerase [Agreia sp. COWG]CAD5989727.1 putative sugar-phosphate epimerase/isomerase [Agreia sp. COWG]
MKIALDPTPLHHQYALLDFPHVVADLGYEWMHLTPHVDFAPFFSHPRVDDDLVARLRKAVSQAGIGIPALLPVQRLSSPDELPRLAAVKNFTRVIQLAVELEVSVINTEFSGRPERADESEAGFYRSMEVLLPLVEREGISLRFDPHPDDFVEDGLEALRILRGLNSDAIGFVYVGSHTFHYGNNPEGIMAAAGTRLKTAYVADSFDHNRSHGLRYISNPPGNAARVHQHLRVGDGDVDWEQFFAGLATNGFFAREDSILVSNVFAEDEDYAGVSRFQLSEIQRHIALVKE